MGATLADALARASAFPGTGLRLLDRHEEPTFLGWSEVQAGACEVSAALQVRGVRRGERVALVLPTGADFFFPFFGAAPLRAIRSVRTAMAKGRIGYGVVIAEKSERA